VSQDACSPVGVQRHFLKLFPRHAVPAVVFGQASVHEREVGVEEIEQAAVFFHNRFEEQQRFTLHVVP